VQIPKNFINKITLLGYETSVNVIHAGEDEIEAKSSVREMFSTL